MHQTRKGQQWYFGMKMHIVVDGRTNMAIIAANAHDKRLLENLLQGEERLPNGNSHPGCTTPRPSPASGHIHE